MVNQDRSQDPQYMSRLQAKGQTVKGQTVKGQTVTLAAQMKSAQMLPTPKAGDGERGRDKARARPDAKGRELPTVVRDQMLPTPRTCSAMASRLDTPGNLESERFPNLETVVAQQLLTPTATDWKGRTNWQAAGRNGPQRLPDLIPTGAATYLNPSFVEEMMGFPVGWTA
jgi:hypothetical protein